ncbi:MAG: hypothetical protein NTY13_00335 [Chlamydiae bacterium]|nr:hypothetical protein [Chlamydiota bacterium]
MNKDEQYIVALYQLAGIGGIKDRYEMGVQVGLSERAVNAILNCLEQANFVKKIGTKQVLLTAQGARLAETLIPPVKK